MKQDPIVYRKIWEYDKAEGYRNSRDCYVYRRDITLCTKGWDRGVYVEFSVLDYYSDNFDKNIARGIEQIFSIIIYDKDIVDTDVKQLVENLGSDQLRGIVAENTAHRVFWKLFVMDPTLNIYIPKKHLEYYHQHAGVPIG